MNFLFFDRNDTYLFMRTDALDAVHTEEEYLFSGIFPLTDNTITRGMRVGFYDQLGVFQLFEVRKVEDDLLDDTQSIEAEHIAIAELLDEIVNVTPTSISAGAAATSVLSGTLWSIGTAVSTDSNNAECKYVSAWEALCTIRDTWSVRIKPRITISGTEISGRYIDIASNVPTNRGVRIEVNKNINQAGVIYDDRGLYTAMVGLGVYDENETALTFTDIVWTAPGDPANKPTDQEWVEDTAATTAYGRNGRKRTGVFYAPEIEDAEELLTATWEYLQTVNTPNVTIDCKIIDLYAYGYEGEQILLGDECNVIIDPLGVERQATVISISRDLLNPEKSDIVLGAYRDDIADMTADNSRASSNVNKIVKSNPDLLNGIINTMVTTILSTGTKMYTDQTDGSLIFETSDGLKAVRITGAGILLASSKVGTVWQWRTAITGSGIVADEITTGTLRATLITIFGSDQFYWDATNIYIINPADADQQIRIGKYDGTNYGIGFTTDGGSTWSTAIGFSGVVFSAGSVTTTFAQDAIPTSLYAGDLWFDTDDGNKCYRATGAGDTTIAAGHWVLVQDTNITDLITSVGGKTTIFYQDAQPTANVTGDIWYDTDASPVVIYRWSGAAWVDITTNALSQALTAAGDAQATADGKIITFAQDSEPTAEAAGDLWVDTNDDNKLYRWSGTAWVAVQDTHLDTTVSNLIISIGGKNTIYYQTAQPTATATGDVWYDTDANPVTIMRWSGSAWVDITTTALSQALTAAGDAQSTADGKIITFAQDTDPTAEATGDLWVDTNDNNKLYRWSGEAWVAYQDLEKTTTFAQDSIPTSTAIGDIWVDTNDSNKTYRAASIGATTIAAGQWVLYRVQSGSVITSSVEITGAGIDINSSGYVHNQTDDFQIKNAAGQNMLRITDEDTGTGEPGARLKLGDTGYPVDLDDDTVWQPKNGGTGYTSGQIHRVTSVPSDSLGIDGDVAVRYAGSGATFTDITPSLGSYETADRFGITRVWNYERISGYRRVGNTTSARGGCYWSFETPAAGLNAMSFNFSSVKYIAPDWYGWNLNLPLTVAVYSGTGSSTILASGTFIPDKDPQENSISLVFSTPLTGATTYYVAIYDPSSSYNMSAAIIQASSVLIPGDSSAASVGIYVKVGGVWVEITAAVLALLADHTGDDENPHEVTAAQTGAVPTSRTVNSKALSSNITLDAGDVGAVPTSRTVNGHALTGNVSVTLSDVGGAAASHAHGNLTTEGKIGSIAGLFVVTSTDGALTVASGLAARGTMRIFYDDTEPASPANGDLWFPAAT